LPDGQKTFARKILSSLSRKNISLRARPKSNLQFRLSRTHKGRLAIVTDVGSGMRWTLWRQAQFFARTNDAATYGEVVWFWRSNAGAK
jgi:hypothetical protein